MNIFYKLDKYIIVYTQIFSNFTQRTFGVQSSHFEQFFNALAVFCAMIIFGKLAIFASMFNLIGSVIIKKKQTSGIINWNRPDSIGRTFGLIVCIIVLYDDIIKYDFWFECLLVAGYFKACSDLPKSESKVKSLLRSLFSVNRVINVSAEATSVRIKS